MQSARRAAARSVLTSRSSPPRWYHDARKPALTYPLEDFNPSHDVPSSFRPHKTQQGRSHQKTPYGSKTRPKGWENQDRPALQIPSKKEMAPAPGSKWIPNVDPLEKVRKASFWWVKDGLIRRNVNTGLGWKFTVEQLRDACSCSLCRDVDSGQKSFSTTEIRTGARIRNVRTREVGGLEVTIDKDMERMGGSDGHKIILSPTFVRRMIHGQGEHPPNRAHRFHRVHWNKEYIKEHVRKIDYEEFMKPDSTPFWDVIQDVMRLGLVFLKNVPRDEHSIERIAERIACIRETFYGRTFDVRAKPNADNVAYTSGYLGLHQDLLYLKPSPQIQILHCMDNDCEGGESLFADGDYAGRILHQQPNHMVGELKERRIPYAYRRHGRNYESWLPLLESTKEGRFNGVRWSPPFQAEFPSATDLHGWLPGARVFEKAVNHPSAVYQTKMAPGDCVLFDNLRVLHGRTAFDAAGGARWLRGTYLSNQDFWSTASLAPATHIESMFETKTWWDPDAADVELSRTDMAKKMEEWLGEEMDQLRDGYRDTEPTGKIDR